MRRNIFFLSISLLAASSFLFGQKVDSSFQIYLLMGQSNMAGRGKITPKLAKLHHPRVMMLDADNQWVEAHHPVHFDKPKIAGVGPGLSFGIAMGEANTKVKIGLVPCAVGGTSIDKWEPGGYDKATNTHPYDDAVKRIKEAMKYGVIKGVIWHQGEANSNLKGAATYLKKLSALIARVRKLVNDPLLPFVAGELGQFKPKYKYINDVLKKLPKKVSQTQVASSKGLEDRGDKTHFDGPSSDEFGKRFAVKMITLQKLKIKKK